MITGLTPFWVEKPNVLDWIITAAYVAIASLCMLAALRRCGNLGAAGEGPRVWWSLALLSLVLGVNKELQLQTLLVHVGRVVAIEEGWYGSRRLAQGLFLVLLFIVSVVIIWKFARRHWWLIRNYAEMTLGLMLVLAYCLLRAADINHLKLLGPKHSGSDFLWPLEVSGLILMLLGSAKTIVLPRSRPTGPDISGSF